MSILGTGGSLMIFAKLINLLTTQLKKDAFEFVIKTQLYQKMKTIKNRYI